MATPSGAKRTDYKLLEIINMYKYLVTNNDDGRQYWVVASSMMEVCLDTDNTDHEPLEMWGNESLASYGHYDIKCIGDHEEEEED